MNNYVDFAGVYDRLMYDVDYKARANYLMRLFKKHDRIPELLLDLACGTGGFSLEFARKGVEVIGVDYSEDMLLAASQKAEDQGLELLLICQKAQELDLYGTVDGAICCMDSLNHITDYDDFKRALLRTALFLEPERLFIFDVNTIHKHRDILSDNTFVIEQEDIYCVWQNYYNEESHMVDIDLDFFVKSGEYYERSGESFSERAYTHSEIGSALEAAGLRVVAMYESMSENAPADDTERIIYVTKRI